MNGHRQSGGHWNVALGLVVRSSDGLGSSGCWSGSGEGSPNGTLFIMRDTPPQRAGGAEFALAAPLGELANKWGKGRIGSFTSPLFGLTYNRHSLGVCSRLLSFEVSRETWQQYSWFPSRLSARLEANLKQALGHQDESENLCPLRNDIADDLSPPAARVHGPKCHHPGDARHQKKQSERVLA